jgi:F420-dependent oxidoreductase-like protein
MRFVLMIEAQQGLSYDEQLAIARRAEAAGFEAMFRSDHYQSFPGGSDEPTTDAWAVLAGLARDTQRIGLGVLVSPVTYRTPGNIAKVAATVDEMSGGRIELGLGAGWHEDEHRRHGFPFPDIKDRADMLEETLEIVHGLWDGEDGWSFQGSYWTVEDARFRPKPRDLPARKGGRPPIILGGEGSPRSMRLAARFADEFNLTSTAPEKVAERFARLDEAIRSAGRDPSSVVHSCMTGVLVGRDEAELERRQRDLLRDLGIAEDDDWFATRRQRWVFGTAEEARESVARFEAAGVERIMLQDFLPRDLDMIDAIAEALLPQG